MRLLPIFLLSMSCASLPQGTPGPAADKLARDIEQRVNKSAWDETEVVSFTFRGSRAHLWDKSRSMLRFIEGDKEVLLDLWDHGGFASKGGVPLEGEAAKKALDDAWAAFCNDTFWLNPLVKLFDDGTTRELLEVDGKRGLVVKYSSGGVTPGDTYLWIVDEKDDPIAVRMWVSVLPAKGIEFTWTNWITLESGARVATEHKAAGVVEVKLDVHKPPPMDPDPFARLVERRL